MGLTTYSFYIESYHGDTLNESLFDKWSARATDKLKAMCGDNLTERAFEQYSEQIQKSVCALADTLYQIDEATKNSNDPKRGNIKSMSSGGQSVSFGDNDTIFTKVLSDKVAQNRLLRDSVVDYIGDTGLLYQGVGKWQ